MDCFDLVSAACGEVRAVVCHIPAQQFTAPFEVGLRFFDESGEPLKVGKGKVDRHAQVECQFDSFAVWRA